MLQFDSKNLLKCGHASKRDKRPLITANFCRKIRQKYKINIPFEIEILIVKFIQTFEQIKPVDTKDTDIPIINIKAFFFGLLFILFMFLFFCEFAILPLSKQQTRTYIGTYTYIHSLYKHIKKVI